MCFIRPATETPRWQPPCPKASPNALSGKRLASDTAGGLRKLRPCIIWAPAVRVGGCQSCCSPTRHRWGDFYSIQSLIFRDLGQAGPFPGNRLSAGLDISKKGK